MSKSTGHRQGGLKGLVKRSIFSVFVVTALVSGFFVANSVFAATSIYVNDATGSDAYDGTSATFVSGLMGPKQTIQAGIDVASDGDTITLGSDITITSQVNVNKAVTIDGGNFTIFASFNKTSNSNNSAIGVGHSDVTIKNLVVDGAAGGQVWNLQLHGINVYQSTGVTLDTVIVSNFGGAAVIVNGSTVTATSLNTNNNIWGAVNVDPGSGVTTPSVFTLSGSGVLAEGTQIWSDGDNVTETATVTVTAAGYNMYKKGGTAAFYVWTNGALTGVATIGTTYYTTIQAAVNAAISGDTVNVSAGTYNEQVAVTKNLHLTGAGVGVSIIQAPSTMPVATDENSNIVKISGSSISVELDGFTISGPGPTGCGSIRAGIFVRDGANANIHDNRIQDIRDSSFSGCQNGQGIWVGRQAWSTSGTATINHNVIVGYQKGGIVVDNTGSSATITNNTVTGVGPTTAIAQNGIQISRGATSTVTGNNISGNVYTGGAGTCSGDGSTAVDKTTFYAGCDTSAGLLLWTHGAGVTASGNIISSNQLGVDVSGSNSAVVNDKNNISGSTLYGMHADAVSINATNNWWGAASGPSGVGKGAGDAVSTNVNYRPWLLEADGDTYALTIALTEPNQWALVSAPTLLSEAPTVINDGEGDATLLIYEGGEFVSPAGDNADIVKPVSAFYAKTTNKGGVGFKYATGGPANTSKDLTVGWNLVGTNTNSSAQNEFATIQNTPTDSGMVTLYVPGISNSRKDWGYTSWELDANHDLNANPITELVNNNLSEYDGYWVFMNVVKAFVKNL